MQEAYIQEYLTLTCSSDPNSKALHAFDNLKAKLKAAFNERKKKKSSSEKPADPAATATTAPTPAKTDAAPAAAPAG